jgi:hypothetical protein
MEHHGRGGRGTRGGTTYHPFRTVGALRTAFGSQVFPVEPQGGCGTPGAPNLPPLGQVTALQKVRVPPCVSHPLGCLLAAWHVVAVVIRGLALGLPPSREPLPVVTGQDDALVAQKLLGLLRTLLAPRSHALIPENVMRIVTRSARIAMTGMLCEWLPGRRGLVHSSQRQERKTAREELAQRQRHCHCGDWLESTWAWLLA